MGDAVISPKHSLHTTDSLHICLNSWEIKARNHMGTWLVLAAPGPDVGEGRVQVHTAQQISDLDSIDEPVSAVPEVEKVEHVLDV